MYLDYREFTLNHTLQMFVLCQKYPYPINPINDEYLFTGDGHLSIDEVVDNIDVITHHSLDDADIFEAFRTLDIHKVGYLRYLKFSNDLPQYTVHFHTMAR